MDTTHAAPTALAPHRPTGRTIAAVTAACALAAIALLPGLETDSQVTSSPAGLATRDLQQKTIGAPTASTGASVAATPGGARAAFTSALPLSLDRAERVSSATLLLVDDRAAIQAAIDRARADVRGLGGHTVSFNETEGRPTTEDPCPLPIDAYSSGGRAVPFPCPRVGQQGDAAQLVVAVPIPSVEALLRKMGAYGSIIGRSTQIVDAQSGLDAAGKRTALLNRQIAGLQTLITSTTGDTRALRGQMAELVRQRLALESSTQGQRAEVRLAEIAINLTTVRPPGMASARNWFQRAVLTGWHRLVALAARLVAFLIVGLPVLGALVLIARPAARRWRQGRTAQAPTPQS